MIDPDRATFDIELVTSLGRMAELEPDWRRLEAAVGSSRPIFFQSFGWNLFVAAMREEHDRGDFASPLVVVWSRHGVPIAILPLAIVKTSGCRVAITLDDPFGQFSCILCAAGEPVDALIGALIGELRQSGSADVLRIGKVVPTSPLFPALQSFGMHESVEHGSVVVDLRPFDTPEAFRASLSKRARRAQRHSWNRLSQHGTIEVRTVDGRDEVAGIIARSVKQRYEWMVALGKTAPAFRDPAYLPMLLALAERAPPDVQLIGFELRLSGEPLALQWGFLHANRYYAYISSRAADHDELSPGRLHLEAILDACIERGIEVAELMSPAALYKLQLGGEIVPITDFEMALSWRGYAMIELWRRRIRPGFKSGYEALPASWRQRINGMLQAGPSEDEYADERSAT